ncbi:amino acid ABC transporter substrate-binding protein, PAAT family [Methylophilus rhizosphaerae]|uniref:Amino acid ABC transporter substrate-binding protein, PAAT family n=1 Tax=Methylophilus rhizosphaerae TaxID=492660 RepID=A0A1G9CTN0_9PROT|nr:quinoprotein dehydrogenase-associated putative ABC transporter substrate-binding protein [Methylophilus rhizosphaerae]SDK54989.1 amino acid ABC transporter substrate-binding protein, PAAT family [Methylophilus rhizosphaerae]
MKITWNILGAIGFLWVTQTAVFAEEIDIPSINPDEGRIGEVRRVADDSEFKVCADPDNMPFSNLKLEGFEDKIAKILADDLGKKLTFQYAYNRQGFLRNTINAMRCDVIMGMTSDFDALRTSTPYYRSGHVFVWRKDSNYNITDWSSPDLKKGIIGIVDKSPATIPLNDHDLMTNARPYRLQRDLNLPTSFIIDDLVAGKIDVAIMWGPIAGYYAKQSKVPLEVRLIPEYNKVNLKGKEYWNISVAVRKKDKDRIKVINEALERNKSKIDAILKEYGIPTVPVVEGDSVYKN